MPNILKIEENEKLLPVLLIIGYLPNLREEFVKLNSKKFRIIIVGNRKPNFLDEFPEVYFLTYKNASILTRLEERVDYAIIFPADPDASKNLEAITGKLTKDRSKSIAVLSTTNLDESLKNLEDVKNLSDLRYCLIGEIISPKGKNESDLSKIIENAIINQKVILTGNESNKVFCVMLDDAITGIQRILFGNFKKDTMHCLFYKTPESILEATRIIARVEPETKIIFSDVSEKNYEMAETLSQTVFKKSGMDISYVDSLDGFENGIEKYFKNKKDFEQTVLEKNKKRKRRIKNTPFVSAVKFSIISLVAGIFLFVFLNLLFFGVGLLYLRQSISNLQNGNFTSAASNAKKSNFFLTIIQPTIELSFDTLSLFDQQSQAQQTYRLLRKAGELSEIGGSTVSSILKSTSISENELLSTIANFSFVFQEGQRINEKANNSSLSKELKNTYSNLLSLSEVLPSVLGFEKEQDYLLLFQNNEELRPTGGFIGSVGDLAVKNGKAKNLKIYDVYDLDAQLKNHVEPPFAVRRYLQPHLYLRDSNFGLDFQETASKSAFIYNLETGKEPSAVVTVDLDVLKEVLKLSGPINLTSFNVTVDDKTISQYLGGTAKDNSFPGTTQKKDILNAVLSKLLERTEKDTKFNIALIKLLPDLLEKKHILVSFSNNSIQKVFSANGYGGSYDDIRLSAPKLINDYLYINEANIGSNKVNPLVSRAISYRAMIGEDSLTSEATLSLTNASKIDDYKVYLTFVVPDKSLLKKISINGAEQSLSAAVLDPQVYENASFIKPVGLETEQYSKDGLTHIAFVTTIQKNSKSDILVQYENGADKDLTNITKYSLFVNKQPGVEPFKLKVNYEYPEGYAPVGISADSYGSNFLEKTYAVDDNLQIDFELQKNR